MAGNDFASGAGMVLGSAMDFATNYALTELAANRQLQNSKKMFDYTFDAQNQRQDFLNYNAATIAKQSLKNAGLSAATMNSSPFSTNVASGAGITGSAETAQMNLMSNLLQMKQLQIQEKVADADADLKATEAAKNRKDLDWIDRINEATLNVQNAEAEYKRGLNEREEKELQSRIDANVASAKLAGAQTTYQQYINETMEKEYPYNGKMVKGKDIPNFEKLVQLELAKETLKVAKYNAETGRREVDGDWKKLLTNEFGTEFVKALKNSGDQYLRNIGAFISQILDGLAQFADEENKGLQVIRDEVFNAE